MEAPKDCIDILQYCNIAANQQQRRQGAATTNSTSSSYTLVQIKREPCQVSEVTTSNNCHQQQHHQQQHHAAVVCAATSSTSVASAVCATSKTMSASTFTTHLVKIEPPSPKIHEMDKTPTTINAATNNSVPIGIAVARKRPQETSTNLNSFAGSTLNLAPPLNKDNNCFGIRVTDLSAVGTGGCGSIFFTGNGDLMTSTATAEELALQSVNRAPSTFWQYPSTALPLDSVISMSPATVGLQYSREASRATAGQVVLLPAATAAALGISNIPPICYTPTDPFQQAAAALVWPSAAAYIPQGTTPTATLQSPHNFIFPSMGPHSTLQPQSYAAAASLQLFNSNYLRSATEFMTAANKATTLAPAPGTAAHTNHLLTSAAALSIPSTIASGPTTLSFDTRSDKHGPGTTTAGLLDLQGNTQALNLMRLPTPPTSATIDGAGNPTAGASHLASQLLFQTTASPVPINASSLGHAGITTNFLNTSSATHPNLSSIAGPPTPLSDDTSAVAMNFKTDAVNSNGAAVAPNILDAAGQSSIVVGVPRTIVPAASAGPPPQMQDVNIQTDTPVCSEDENSCPLGMHQQQTMLGENMIHEAAENGDEEGRIYDTNMEPLELTKSAEKQQPLKLDECHKINNINNISKDNNKYEEKTTIGGLEVSANEIVRGNSSNDENRKANVETARTLTVNEVCSAVPSANGEENNGADFAGLELLSNISASTLITKRATSPTINAMPHTTIRVKQEPMDTEDDNQHQHQKHQQSMAHAMSSSYAPKVEKNPITIHNVNNSVLCEQPAALQEPAESLQPINPQIEQMDESVPMQDSTTASLPTPEQPRAVEPVPEIVEPLGGLSLLCALAEQRIQEEEVQSNFFNPAPVDTTLQDSMQRVTSSFSYSTPTHQQQQQQIQQSPFHLDQPFPSMDGIELPPAAVQSPSVVKRKKHKHSKSSKSSGGLSNLSKVSKHCTKKSKKKLSKEKKRLKAAAAAAAVAEELDFDDEQLQQELRNAFSCMDPSYKRFASPGQWPSPKDLFNMMESNMKQRLAEINRQYRKKKRKLEEISKVQKKKKKCSKLLAQQQQLTSSTSGLSLGSMCNSNTSNILSNSGLSSDFKFISKFSSSGGASTATTMINNSPTSSLLQPSSLTLRFPPQQIHDPDSDKKSLSTASCSLSSNAGAATTLPNYKTVRLEPSALSAAVNGMHANNISSSTVASDSCYRVGTPLRLTKKHASNEKIAHSLSKKERKLIMKSKTKKHNMRKAKGKMNSMDNSEQSSPSLAGGPQLQQQQQQQQQTNTRPSSNPIDRQLTLTSEYLYRKETRVLTDMGGLFYAGIMKPLQPPDVYAITLDGERGNKPHIMSREEIYKDTIIEITPKSKDCVPIGTRLCAYWSQQYRCLYPGRAIESESSEDNTDDNEEYVSVEFDDGDSGRIRLCNIRFLCSDYPIVEYNDNPLYSLGKHKKSSIKSNSTGVGGSVCSGQSNHEDENMAATESLAQLRLSSINFSNSCLNGNCDQEMYARRTEKKHKRLKKNLKRKTQTGNILAASCANNNFGSLDHATASKCIEHAAELSRKHHKHKKRKKHKKHHRKGVQDDDDEDDGRTFIVQTTGSVLNCTPNGVYFTTDNKSPNSRLDTSDIPILQEKRELQDQPPQESISSHEIRATVAHRPIKIEPSSNLDDTATGVTVKTENLEDVEEESVSNMMSEVSDEARGDDDEVEHNNSKGSKIAAFLPERQLWGWYGTAYRKAGVKGRGRKQFYKTIKRGKEMITVGDCAVFLSTGRPDRPYIGRIESMWETGSSNKVVRVKWFYHPEETTGCPTLKYPGGLFESPHEDENDVQTISHHCEVLPFERYFAKFGADAKQYESIYDNNDTYYLAGYYNPRSLNLSLQDDIPMIPDDSETKLNNSSNATTKSTSNNDQPSTATTSVSNLASTSSATISNTITASINTRNV